MLVDIADIKRSAGLWKTFEFEGPLSFDELELKGPVKAEFKLTNAGSRVLVNGRVAATVQLTCCRCAEGFVQPMDVRVEEYFIPEDSEEAPREEGLSLEDLNIFTYNEDRIEIDEILRQNLLAALPVKPLCRQDCRGLCEQCGTNLNEGSCQCSREELDPRWAPLHKLKTNGSSGSDKH